MLWETSEHRTRTAAADMPEKILIIGGGAAQASSWRVFMTFRPRVSAVLNITPDHLNRHHTMEAYSRMQRRILRRIRHQKTICVSSIMKTKTDKERWQMKYRPEFYISAVSVNWNRAYIWTREDIVYKPKRRKKETVMPCKTGELQILGDTQSRECYGGGVQWQQLTEYL